MNLYRQYFTAEEIAMLDATPPDDLTSEINLLRVLLARLLATATQHLRELTHQRPAGGDRRRGGDRPPEAARLLLSRFLFPRLAQSPFPNNE